MFRDINHLLRNGNNLLFVYAALCAVAALVCLILTKYSSLQVTGISAWSKPFKFFMSIAIFSFTMAIYVSFLANTKQVHLYAWSFIVFLSIEVLLITFQAARGKQSHFNTETPFDNMIYAIMGIAIFTIVIHTLYLSTLFFTQKHFAIGDEMVLAIQLSLIMMVLFAFEGFVMVLIQKHSIGSQDGIAGIPVLGWNKNNGDLRVAHFFGIHALQIIPLASYFLAKTKREVVLICVLYFVFVTYTLIQAIQGKPLFKL